MNTSISIILSTYNEKLVIEETIRELIKHIENVEIVVVDDNSPDGTFEILKKIDYKRTYLNLIIKCHYWIQL